MDRIIEIKDKANRAYVLGYAEGYSLARDFGKDLPEGAPRPLEERVHKGQDWKQGRKDGYKAGLCDRGPKVLFDHSLHTKLGEPHDWSRDRHVDVEAEGLAKALYSLAVYVYRTCPDARSFVAETLGWLKNGEKVYNLPEADLPKRLTEGEATMAIDRLRFIWREDRFPDDE